MNLCSYARTPALVANRVRDQAIANKAKQVLKDGVNKVCGFKWILQGSEVCSPHVARDCFS